MTDCIRNMERDLPDLIDTVARMTRDRFDRWARSYHLTRAQCVTLKRLRDQPGACQNDIACQHNMEPITISRQLDKLEALGLVERRGSVDDRRIRHLHVLPKGNEVVELAEKYWDQLGMSLIGDLSASECQALARALLVMRNRLIDAGESATRAYGKSVG
jgi:MarR family transcriptional regulator, transcriptional regulator for hemolysin